ncbi:uncharacterized protein G2W53_022581 [Senna tora]|uniref:Putative plant transposon protein domain-containing protein n=1 Tax=Senna tora TaxID=362788 RepID=A0A834WIV9_9FABA|nr:uncharacterized protein G2W53_022581 [Senna tora]
MERTFELGQRVLLYNSLLKLFPGKLKTRWSEPFVITKVTPYGAIEVKDEKTNSTFLTNGQRLKHYFEGDMAPPKTVAGPSKRKARNTRARAELDLDSDLDRSMVATVDVLQWADFIKPPTTAGMLSIVQEFYAKFADKDADDRVFVRARAWLHFLSCRLLPGSHCTEVTKDRVLLINCLITKQTIDAAQIILNHLTSVAAKKLASHEHNPSAPTLAFPALITSLCKRAGVVIPPTEVPLKIIAPVSAARVARSGRRDDSAGPSTTVASSAHYRDPFMKDLYERQEQYHRTQMVTIERNHLFVVGELENLRRQVEHQQECLQVVHHNLLALIRQRDGIDLNPATRPFTPRPSGLR